mmetsp:Transcript_4616/g.14962  ORF Transcript_4616/g.14962 Transcript_4616/m.14962 type:complete len:231 (-) Transcript_4616:365-1057(-)
MSSNEGDTLHGRHFRTRCLFTRTTVCLHRRPSSCACPLRLRCRCRRPRLSAPPRGTQTGGQQAPTRVRGRSGRVPANSWGRGGRPEWWAGRGTATAGGQSRGRDRRAAARHNPGRSAGQTSRRRRRPRRKRLHAATSHGGCVPSHRQPPCRRVQGRTQPTAGTATEHAAGVEGWRHAQRSCRLQPGRPPRQRPHPPASPRVRCHRWRPAVPSPVLRRGTKKSRGRQQLAR